MGSSFLSIHSSMYAKTAAAPNPVCERYTVRTLHIDAGCQRHRARQRDQHGVARHIAFAASRVSPPAQGASAASASERVPATAPSRTKPGRHSSGPPPRPLAHRLRNAANRRCVPLHPGVCPRPRASAMRGQRGDSAEPESRARGIRQAGLAAAPGAHACAALHAHG